MSIILNDITSQLSRIRQVLGVGTDKELAAWFGCSPACVTRVRRRGVVPDRWLLMLVEAKGVNPEWVKTGCGPREIARVFAYVPEGRYESGDEAYERHEDENALRRLSSRALAEELLCRIAKGT